MTEDEKEEYIDKFKHYDNDRFLKLFDIVHLKPTCLRCYYFRTDIDATNTEKRDEIYGHYRCHGAPWCTAATLHPDVIEYIRKGLTA